MFSSLYLMIVIFLCKQKDCFSEMLFRGGEKRKEEALMSILHNNKVQGCVMG